MIKGNVTHHATSILRLEISSVKGIIIEPLTPMISVKNDFREFTRSLIEIFTNIMR